jgi:sulfur carrier protein ThiS
MVRFTLPSYLFALLPEDERRCSSFPRSVSLDPGSWVELVQEMRQRFPLFAKRVLTESGSIATGFVVAVNDEVMQGGYSSLDFGSGDEVTIIAAMAGG